MKTMTRAADALLTRLVPQTSAEAGLQCWSKYACSGYYFRGKCGNQYARILRKICRKDGYDEIVRQTFVGCCA